MVTPTLVVAHQEEADIVKLLQRMHYEMVNLLIEMAEILPFPAVRYELYPRLVLAVRIYEYGKKETLGAWIDADSHSPNYSFESLDAVPFKDDQTLNSSWRAQFLIESAAVRGRLKADAENLFPRLNGLPQAERSRLESMFKQKISHPPIDLMLKAVRK